MAILNHGSTIRTADGGQTTTTIVTATNIGSYGVALNSTYYIGTTQNIFNRASGAQTLTGVSIDGNAATATNGLTTGNYAGYSTFSGVVSSASGGFQTATYAAGRNRIWSFGNSDGYGLAYFQGSGGVGGYDVIGMHFGTATAAASQYQFNAIGSFTASGDVRAPIFYDSGNTAYYIDPASTSNLVGLTVTNTITGSITGNAGTATILQTARNINGTSFNGSAAITTASWGTARTLTIGSTGKSVDGSAAVAWSLAEIGAAAIAQTMFIGTTSVAINRASAGQTLTGISIDGNSGGIYAAGQAFIQTTSSGTSYVQHIQVREAAGGGGLTSEIYAPALGFHWSGVVASNILMESSGRMSIRNNPGTGYENFIANIVYGNSSVQTPILYDSNDTTYYLDPASTGTALAIAGNAGVGTASPTLSSGKGLHINSSSSHANLKLQSSGRTWELLSTTGAYFSVYDTTGGADRLAITSGGNVGVATTAADTNLQVVGHVHVGNQTTFENTGGWNKTIYLDGTYHARVRVIGSAYASGKNSQTETYLWVDNTVSPYSGLATNAGSFQISAGFTTMLNSARSPLFYDSDNTAYYIDAASTSNLVGLTVANTITGSITGNAANVTGTVAIANGGTGATSAANARTNLGATTVGSNLFILTNPSAVTFLRVNADNTVSALDAATFRTAIGAGTGGGSVTSVGGTGTVSGLTLTGTVTTTGNLTLGGTLSVLPSNFASQTANTFLAAPNAAAGTPTFRSIVAADIPTLNQNTTGSSGSCTGNAATVTNGVYTTGDQTISGIKYFTSTVDPSTVPAGYAGGYILESTTGFGTYGIIFGSATGQHGAIGYSSNTMYFGTENGTDNTLNTKATLSSGGTFTANGDVRSPIFYDSANTAYYIDGASGSKLKYLQIDGDWGSSPFGSGHESFTIRSTYASMVQRQTNGSLGYWLHHIASDAAYYLYGGRGATDGSSWDWALRAYTNQDGNYVEFNTSARAQIFYDRNDTTYYTDPASISRLNTLNVVGAVTAARGVFSDSSGSGSAIIEAYNTVATNGTTAIFRQTTAGGNGNQDIGLIVDIQGAADTDRIANFRYYNGSTYTSRMAVMRGGNVGIGTISPSGKLHVYNSTSVDTILESGTSGTTGKLIFKTSDNVDLNKYIMQENYYMILNGHTNEGFKFRDSASNVLLSIFGANNAYASRVGIGTQTPSYKLDVNGAINSSTYVYAGVFYDNDNTAYYANPSGASIFNGLKLVSSGNEASGSDYSLWIQGGNEDWGIGINKSAANYGITYNLAASHTYAIQGSKNGAEYFRLGTDMLSHDTRLQAPIFYDSNDTGYYLDPASTSRLNNLTVIGTMTFGTLAYTTESRRSKNSSNVDIETVTGLVSPSGPTFLEIRGFCPPTMYRTTGDRPAPYGIGFGNGAESGGIMPIGAGDNLQEIMLYGANSGPTTFTFKRQIWEGNAQDPSFSNYYGSSVFSINTGTGAVTASTDIRSPIYYDQNNTAYYIDAASTSVLNAFTGSHSGGSVNVTSVNGAYLGVNNTTNTNGYGISLYNGAVAGEPTYGLMFQGTATFGTHGSVTGDWATYFTMNNDNTRGWIFRKTGGGGNIASISGGGILTVAGDVRSTIFYDSNNTAYYVDPASTSSLNALTMAGTITGALDSTISFAGGACAAASYNYILSGANDGGNKLVIFVNGTTRTADGGVNALIIRNDGGAFILGQASYLTSILGSSVTINGNAALTSASTLTAGNLSGTIPSAVLGNSSLFVGTTSIALNRASASQTLTGVSIDGNSATTTLATKATRANGNFYIDDNFGNTVVGNYNAARLQGVFAMGDSYKLAADGTAVGTLYGLAWSHPNFGGVAANLADHGLLILQNGVFKGAWGGGSLRTPGDVRGTLFYDWDNTGYYCDPASTSNLNTITAAGNITAAQYYTGGWFRNSSSGNGLYNESSTQHFYSDDVSYWNVASSSSAQGIRLRTGGHAGTVRGYFYADTNNDVGLLNNAGSWRVRIVGGDYLLADGSSIRGQIFYDTNNTAYYIDAASTSNLNGLNVVDANLELYKSQTVDMSNTTTYSTSNYYPVTISVPTEGCIIQIQNNLNSNVPSWATHGGGFTLNLKWRTNGSGWGTTAVRRIIDQYFEQFTNQTICGGITQMTNSSIEVVWLRGGGQYLFKFSRNLSATAQSATYTVNSQSVSPTSTAQNTVWSSYSGAEIKYNDQTISTSNMYTPVLYDWNNSAYYVDPSSTSNLVGLTVANTITGSISGNAGTATTLATARTLTIGSTGKTFNGSADVSWSTTEIVGYTPAYGNAAYQTKSLDTISTPGLYQYDGGFGGTKPPDNSPNYRTIEIGSAARFSQIAMPWNSDGYYFRRYDGTSFSTWRTVLHDGNYNSYAPTLTGTGASGSWGISVTGSSASCTGNAATATILQTARNINGTSFNGSAAITTATWGTARTITIGSTGKSVDGSANVSWTLAELGAAATNQTMFIGTTSIAINRASASQTLTGTSIDGSSASCTGNAATVTNGMYLSGDQNISGAKYFTSNKGATSTVGANNTYSLEAFSSDAGAAGMSFHRGGYYAVNMGLDPDNVLRIGGWSASANRLQLDMSGNLTVAGAMYGTNFIDSDNTAYFCNPASTSNLVGLTVANTITGAVSGNAGSVTINYNNDSNSTYQMLWGSGNNVYGTAGVYLNPSTDYVTATSFNASDWFRSSGATGWYNSTYGGGIYMNDTTWVRIYNNKYLYCDTIIQAGSDMRSPVYYDANDTAYYVDAASTSNLLLVKTRNTFGERVAVTAAASTTVNTQYNLTELTMAAFITTLTFSNIQSTGTVHMWTIVTLGNGSATSVTWPAAIKWPGGTAPNITGTNTKRDIYQFITYDGGTNIYAIIVGQNL